MFDHVAISRGRCPSDCDAHLKRTLQSKMFVSLKFIVYQTGVSINFWQLINVFFIESWTDSEICLGIARCMFFSSQRGIVLIILLPASASSFLPGTTVHFNLKKHIQSCYSLYTYLLYYKWNSIKMLILAVIKWKWWKIP